MTAATGCGWPAPSSRSAPRIRSEQTFLLERASTAAYIAYQRAGNAGDEADALAVLGRAMSERKLWRPALDSLRLSLDLREVAEVRGQYEKMRDEHGFRLLDYTIEFGFRLAAGLFPVLRGSRQAHRFRAVRCARRQRQAGADLGRQAALRRRAETRRALQHQSARRPAVDRQGGPAEIGGIQHLCARPQAVRPLYRPRLCAAAHRPARHSAGQRQYPGGVDRRIPDRRPQPDQHRDRWRFSAGLEPLRTLQPRR